jgi:hypothetical protein
MDSNNLISSLEGLMMLPEMIDQHRRRGTTYVVPKSEEELRNLVFQSQPPRCNRTAERLSELECFQENLKRCCKHYPSILQCN